MGFEARWTAGGWQVVDVPAVDEPAEPPASSGSRARRRPPRWPRPAPAGSGTPTTWRPMSRNHLHSQPKRRGRLPEDRPDLLPGTPSYGISRDARSGAPASTRRAGLGLGVAAIDPGDPRPPARSSYGCSGRALGPPLGDGPAPGRDVHHLQPPHLGLLRPRELAAVCRREPAHDHIHFSFSWAGAVSRPATGRTPGHLHPR